ncbi:MAG: glycosyltransferase [Verrucomicrobiae bacterium]|nr:glycosyltransferase [Verrucomicrobiae bacterium]
MAGHVIFLQRRTHRAGAQTCLARLLRHPAMQKWNPVLVCEDEGWLAQTCRKAGVRVLVNPFPSARTLAGRLWRNQAFAGQVAAQLRRHRWTPQLVHANDHWDALLGLTLARRLHVPSAVFLRSPGMKPEDYDKYGCREMDLVIAVGDELQQRAQNWDMGRGILLIHDGLEAAEQLPPKPRPASFPPKILVLGSPLDWKGWADLTEALWLLQQDGNLPPIQWDFTGDRPDPARNNLKLERLTTGQFHFLGRVEEFRELVRQYDLALQTSWHESFGMAALETLFAGVPLLSTRVGVIEQVLEAPAFLVPPRRPAILAQALQHLMQHWPTLDPGVEKAQQLIRARFLIDYAVDKLLRAYADQLGLIPP